MSWHDRLESGLALFLSSTSIHGPAYIVKESFSAAARLVWACAVVASLVFAGIFLKDLFQDWEAHPVIYTVGQEVPVQELKVRTT